MLIPTCVNLGKIRANFRGHSASWITSQWMLSRQTSQQYWHRARHAVLRIEGGVDWCIGAVLIYVSMCVWLHNPPITYWYHSPQSSSDCWMPGRCHYLEDSHDGRSRSWWTSSSSWRHLLLDSGTPPRLWLWFEECSSDCLCRHHKTLVCTAWCWSSLTAVSASLAGPLVSGHISSPSIGHRWPLLFFNIIT